MALLAGCSEKKTETMENMTLEIKRPNAVDTKKESKAEDKKNVIDKAGLITLVDFEKEVNALIGENVLLGDRTVEEFKKSSYYPESNVLTVHDNQNNYSRMGVMSDVRVQHTEENQYVENVLIGIFLYEMDSDAWALMKSSLLVLDKSMSPEEADVLLERKYAESTYGFTLLPNGQFEIEFYQEDGGNIYFWIRTTNVLP